MNDIANPPSYKPTASGGFPIAGYIEGSEIGRGQPPAWLEASYRRFETIVLQRGYPCYFGTNAVRSGDLFISAVEHDNLERLPDTLSTFIEVSRTLRGRRNNLVVFFQPLQRLASHDHYKQTFWQVMQYLHDRDPLPDAVPQSDTEDTSWEFPFAGELFFVVGASPSYRRRASRNLGPGLVMIFQPRDVFEHSEAGEVVNGEAREIIRRRLEQWDQVSPHPEMGVYGEPSNVEWRQYFVPDGNELVLGKCPLRMQPAKSECHNESGAVIGRSTFEHGK
jgi:uncharacterized protein